MGWFSSSKDDEPPTSSSSASYDDTSSSFGADPYSGGGGGGGGALSGGGGGGGGASEIQQFAAQLQQQTLVQNIITDITEQALEKCLTSNPKDSKLSGREAACVHSVTNKWMDTNEFMNGRMGKKAQQAAQQQGGAMQMH